MPPWAPPSAPPRLVPPEKEDTAIRRVLHADRIAETWGVEVGKKTVDGVEVGGAGECGVLDLEARMVGSEVWGIS